METLVENIRKNGVPDTWSDTMKMQASLNLKQKGYRKKVTWKQSVVPWANIGIFAAEDIRKGEVIRVLEENKNLIVFRSKNDIPPLTPTTKDFLSNYICQSEDLCLVMIPGTSFNHSEEKVNMKMVKISEHVVHIVARRDITCGDEIFEDYNDSGSPPDFLAETVREHGMSLIFKGFNDFV